MNIISAEDYELLGFFEVEPQLLEEGIPWCYNDSVYEVVDGNRTFSVAIHPSYKDIRIVLREGDVKLFELEAMGVEDIRVLNKELPETLEIKINNSHALLIKRKPHVTIYQKITENT